MMKKGFNLVELLITISVFSVLGLVMSILTTQFVGTFMRSRDIADLQRLSSALFTELESGDAQYFDGLKGAAQILNATDKSISFVPLYREVSQKIGTYRDQLMTSYEAEAGPPRTASRSTGGLRIQFNEKSGQYELRYYLSRHPRAGSSAPEVSLQQNNRPSVGTSKDGVPLVPMPLRFVWVAPQGGDVFPQSYVVFSGGKSPLSFPGTKEFPPSISVAELIMRTNAAQLFPNPFLYPDDILNMYYEPEIESNLIRNQEHLAAHLFIKDSTFNSADPRYNFFSDPAGSTALSRMPLNSLLLYYDKNLQIFPTQAALTNLGLTNFRPQFPTTVPGNNLLPSKFSYFSTRETSTAISLVSENSQNTVPGDLLSSVALLRLDLLVLIGGTLENFGDLEISQQNFSHLIALDQLRFSQAIMTKASAFNPVLGFARNNCPGGTTGDVRCRLYARNFPSGRNIQTSGTFYLSNFVYDPRQFDSLEGALSLNLKSITNQKVYKVKIDFTRGAIKAMRKISITAEDLAYDPDVQNPDVSEFPIDNSQFISFTNLQTSGFLDEGLNYQNPTVYTDHLGDSPATELSFELSPDSNIEGFSLTFLPR